MWQEKEGERLMNDNATWLPTGVRFGWRLIDRLALELGTRMPVYAIASAFRAGQGLNAILQDYPFLTLEEIEAALHYYLSHKQEIDEGLERSELEWLAHKYGVTEALR